MVYQETGNPFFISADIPSTYTATHTFNSIPLLSGITLTDIAKSLVANRCEECECIVRIYGAYHNVPFIKQEIKIQKFRLSDYTLKGANSAIFDLSSYNLLPSKEFMNSLSSPVNTSVTVSVTIGGRASSRTFYIQLLPFGHLYREMPCELVASYVLPGCTMAKRAKSACGAEEKAQTRSEILRKTSVVASVMKNANLTYSPLMPEIDRADCIVRDYDSVAFSNNRGMSLTEALLLYCSMAEGAGLNPCAIFLKKDTTAVKALAGVHITGKKMNAVCESIAEIREMVLSGDIVLFDIVGLLGTEEADFARNIAETTASFAKSPANLIFAVDIDSARELGVRSVMPMYRPAKKNSTKEIYKNVGEAITAISEKGEKAGLYSFSPYSGNCLGICAKANSLEFGKVYTVGAIDEDVLCSDPDSFSYISTYKVQNISEHPRNMTEQSVYDSKVRKLLERIESERRTGGLCLYSANSFLSGKKQNCKDIRDDVNNDIAVLSGNVRNNLFTDLHTELYAAAGSVSFTKNGKKLYAPCAFVPCSISVEPELIKLSYGIDRAIFNMSLIDETEGILGRPEISTDTLYGNAVNRQAELSEILSHFARLSNYDSRFTYHPDTFLGTFDLSSFLMRGCIENTESKLFGKCILEGEYKENEEFSYSFLKEDSIPFDIPASLCDAVKCADSNSVIISGPHGSGKKEAASGIAIKNHLSGKSTLISSKYSETIRSFMNVFDENGLSELCLVVENGIKMRKQILSDINTLMTPVERVSEQFYEKDEYADLIDSYADELHKVRAFGYSLYDCIDEYCKSCEKSSDSPLDINSSLYNMTSDSIDELLNISKELCDSARNIANAVTGSTIKELKIDKLGVCTPIGNEIKNNLEDSAEQLSVFCQKSNLARESLGIPHSALYDIRSLRAFGDFLESVIFSGVDFMPEKLLKDGVYSKAKLVEEICPVIDELRGLEGIFENITEDITEISARSLYTKWQMAENNIFTRGAVIRELKRYLPSAIKLSSSQTSELLFKLARREELLERYEALRPQCSDILGQLWKELKTDTETARRAARFATLSDSCSSRMFRTGEPQKDIRQGITSLIDALKTDEEARSDLLIAVGAFRRLIGNSAPALLDNISKTLCVDLYDMRFEDGILGESGLAKLLLDLSSNAGVFELLPEYNALKKRASGMGISSFINLAEVRSGDKSCSYLFRKSIFASLAKSTIENEPVLSRVDSKTFEEYIRLYKLQKQSAAYSIIKEHRENFISYIENPEGKNKLDSLCREIRDLSYTNFELYARNSDILGMMYSIILSTTFDAYRLNSYPSVLILADSEKTDTSFALPLCACFDKCIFLKGENIRSNSIIDLLPKGIPSFSATKVLSQKNSYVSELVATLGADINYTRSYSGKEIHFVRSEGGMYDRNTRTNRIEALTACETAMAVSEKDGYDNVGIVALTPSQCAEIVQILGVLAKKHGKSKIAKIPVRYIGNMGDFSKKTIVLSVTFGKNVYSVTRSFGIFDCGKKKSDSTGKYFASVLHELICADRNLYVVSSILPSDIQTDTLGIGAYVISSLISFALYGTIPKKLANAEEIKLGGIEKLFSFELLQDDTPETITVQDGIIRTESKAFIYNCLPGLTIYDRTVHPYSELSLCGCETSFVMPTELLYKTDTVTLQK